MRGVFFLLILITLRFSSKNSHFITLSSQKYYHDLFFFFFSSLCNFFIPLGIQAYTWQLPFNCHSRICALKSISGTQPATSGQYSAPALALADLCTRRGMFAGGDLSKRDKTRKSNCCRCSGITHVTRQEILQTRRKNMVHSCSPLARTEFHFLEAIPPKMVERFHFRATHACCSSVFL